MGLQGLIKLFLLCRLLDTFHHKGKINVLGQRKEGQSLSLRAPRAPSPRTHKAVPGPGCPNPHNPLFSGREGLGAGSAILRTGWGWGASQESERSKVMGSKEGRAPAGLRRRAREPERVWPTAARRQVLPKVSRRATMC